MKFTSLAFVLLLTQLVTSHAKAEIFVFWEHGPGSAPVFTDPKLGCDFLYSPLRFKALVNSYLPEHNYYSSDLRGYYCAKKGDGSWGRWVEYFGVFTRKEISCPPGGFDYSARKCSLTAQKGNPGETLSCEAPKSGQGNPINSATGNKYQSETDFKNDWITIGRHYNSTDGVWRHSFASYIYFANQKVILVHADGRESALDPTSGLLMSDLGTLAQQDNIWLYQSPSGEKLFYNAAGRLISTLQKSGEAYDLTYDKDTILIANKSNKQLSLREDLLHQPLSISTEGLAVTYSYNTSNRLVSVKSSYPDQELTKTLHYEISGKPNLLTGLTDERGIRYATWQYDSQGRATASEHNNGADKVTISYNPDGSSTVTNSLGRKTIYRFAELNGARRITSIQGEPSVNCPNSNSSFTYDSNGLLKTKTDNKGNLTTYTYNTRGLEVSRTEASGTPQARTITTDWHPTLFLPTVVTEPNQITRYQYDDQGRQLSRTVEAR